MDISRLRPFHGLHSSLLSFSAGYTFRISHWSRTPTEFGSFSNLWMVTGEDRRLLFADPPQSERIVCIYHNFDEVWGGQISLVRPDPTRLHLFVRADNATSVEIDLRLERSLGTRLLVALSRGMPTTWAAKDPVVRLVGGLAAAFIAKGNVKIAGKTETAEPFFAGDVDELFLVREGYARVNGAVLGYVSPPGRRVAFGDFATTPQAYVMAGRLYLAYPGAAAKAFSAA